MRIAPLKTQYSTVVPRPAVGLCRATRHAPFVRVAVFGAGRNAVAGKNVLWQSRIVTFLPLFLWVQRVAPWTIDPVARIRAVVTSQVTVFLRAI